MIAQIEIAGQTYVLDMGKNYNKKDCLQLSFPIFFVKSSQKQIRGLYGKIKGIIKYVSDSLDCNSWVVNVKIPLLLFYFYIGEIIMFKGINYPKMRITSNCYLP